VVETDDLYGTRMYDSPIAAWRGWSRIYYGSFASIGHLLLAASFLTVASILPWMCLVVAVAGLASPETTNTTPWAIAACAWLGIVLLEQSMAWRLYGVLRVSRAWSLAYILGAAVTLGMLLNAMLKKTGLGRTTWRGTVYRGSQLEGRSAADHGTEKAEEPAARV